MTTDAAAGGSWCWWPAIGAVRWVPCAEEPLFPLDGDLRIEQWLLCVQPLDRRSLLEQLWMVEQRSGSLVFYLEPALRRPLTAQRVLQLSSPQVPEQEPVPGTRVAVTDGDAARLARYVPLDELAYERAGHYRVYDGPRLLHADAPKNDRPVPAHVPYHRPLWLGEP